MRCRRASVGRGRNHPKGPSDIMGKEGQIYKTVWDGVCLDDDTSPFVQTRREIVGPLRRGAIAQNVRGGKSDRFSASHVGRSAVSPLPLFFFPRSAIRSFFQSTPRRGEIWRWQRMRGRKRRHPIRSVGGFGLDKRALPSSPLLSAILVEREEGEVTLFGIGKWRSKEALSFFSPSLPSISRFESKNTRRAPKPINCLRGASQRATKEKESRRFQRSRRN